GGSGVGRSALLSELTRAGIRLEGKGAVQGYPKHNRRSRNSQIACNCHQVLANTEGLSGGFQRAIPRPPRGNGTLRKNSRKKTRETAGTKVWIRFDDGFSVRACRLVDLSATGVRIVVDAPHDVADRFSLLLSRGAVPGRRCRVKWRQGSEIGAEFVGSGR